jgi:DNA-binding transcriptional LysR family regulator
LNPTVGEVRIGTTAFRAVNFVSTVIDRLSRRYPRIVFHLVIGAARTQYGELRARNLDLLITRRLSSVADAGLNFEFLFDDSFVVAAGAQSQWARRRRIELDDLINEPWVLPPPEGGIATIALEAFSACGLDAPRATVFARAPETRMSLLVDLQGVERAERGREGVSEHWLNKRAVDPAPDHGDRRLGDFDHTYAALAGQLPAGGYHRNQQVNERRKPAATASRSEQNQR